MVSTYENASVVSMLVATSVNVFASKNRNHYVFAIANTSNENPGMHGMREIKRSFGVSYCKNPITRKNFRRLTKIFIICLREKCAEAASEKLQLRLIR